MIVVPFDPVIVAFGPVAVRWFGVLALVGLGVGLWMACRETGSYRDRLLDAAAWAIPAGVLSARLVHILGSWEYYFTRPWEVWQVYNLSGLSLWGALAGGGLAAALALRRDAWARIRIADATAPSLALGIAIGRIGSFINGDGQGLPSSLPWATQYVHEATAVPDFGVPRHPAQVYDGLVALVLFAIVKLVPRSAPPGVRFWIFVAGYGAARVALGAVRLDPPFALGLQLDQIFAVAGLVLVANQAFLAALRRRGPVARASA